MAEVWPDSTSKSEIVGFLSREVLSILHADPEDESVDHDDKYGMLAAIPLELDSSTAAALSAWLGFLLARDPEVRLTANDCIQAAVASGGMDMTSADFLMELAEAIVLEW